MWLFVSVLESQNCVLLSVYHNTEMIFWPPYRRFCSSILVVVCSVESCCFEHKKINTKWNIVQYCVMWISCDDEWIYCLNNFNLICKSKMKLTEGGFEPTAFRVPDHLPFHSLVLNQLSYGGTKPVWWIQSETTLYKVGMCLGPSPGVELEPIWNMNSPNFGNPESCSIFWVNILKRRLPDSSDQVLSILKVLNNEVAGTSLFGQKKVVNEEVILKFNVTPYAVLLYVLLKVPAVESDLPLPS